MCIERVQEGRARDAICSSNSLKAGGIDWTGIATDNIVAGAAWIVWVIYSELSVIENIEELRAELNLAGLRDLKMLEQRQIEVQAAGIVQEVSPGIAKGQSPWSHKLRGISDKWTEALDIPRRFEQSLHYVRIGGRDAQPAGNSGIVSK